MQLLGIPTQRVAAIRELVGGVGATELRQASPSRHATQALIDGLRDQSPQVRWWCVQLIDHLPDDERGRQRLRIALAHIAHRRGYFAAAE